MTFAIISRCDVTALAPIFSLSVLSAVLFDSGNFTYCIMRVMMLSVVRNTRLESLSLTIYPCVPRVVRDCIKMLFRRIKLMKLCVIWRLLLHTVRNEWKKMNRAHPGTWGAEPPQSHGCAVIEKDPSGTRLGIIFIILFCFFVFIPEKERKKFTTHGALCVFFERVFFFLRLFFINLFFRILLFLFEKRGFLRCQSNIRKESLGLIVPLLSLRSLTYSSGSFFSFSNDGRKKKFRLNEKRQNSLFRVVIPGTFPALVVTLLLLSDAHTHTKRAI
jgi:hypothetical protein